VLTAAELGELEGTLLPALERHHLRLLAHALRTLQAIAGRRQGRPPEPGTIRAWAERQPAIAGDAGFHEAFLTQLLAAAVQIEAIAAAAGAEPLGLELPALMAWARRQADHRLRGEPPHGGGRGLEGLGPEGHATEGLSPEGFSPPPAAADPPPG
jgi:hypothetical protein